MSSYFRFRVERNQSDATLMSKQKIIKRPKTGRPLEKYSIARMTQATLSMKWSTIRKSVFMIVVLSFECIDVGLR